MKIYSRQITDTIVKTKVPKDRNISVFPNTSTFDFLLLLSIIINKTKRAKKEAHIFLENKSAAFDSIS
jgi:hypothetical protein